MHVLNEKGLGQTTKLHQKGLTTPNSKFTQLKQKRRLTTSQPQKGGLATPPNTKKGTKSPQHLNMSITGPQAQKGVNKIPNLKKG